MVRRFPVFRSIWKKRSTSGGSPQFLNGFFPKISVPFEFLKFLELFSGFSEVKKLLKTVKKILVFTLRGESFRNTII